MTTPADRLLQTARTLLGGGDPMVERERLVADLTAALPERTAEIAALGAALSLGAGGRLARAGDAEEAVARLADDVALLTGGPAGVAHVGAALAARLLGHAVALPDLDPTPAAGPDRSASWVGATEVLRPAGPTPSPNPTAPSEPERAAPADLLGTVVAGRTIRDHLGDPKVLAGLAIAIGLVFYAQSGGSPPSAPAPTGGTPSAPDTAPPPAGRPAPTRPPTGTPSAGPQDEAPPMLVAPGKGVTLPTLRFEQNDTAHFYAFALPTDAGGTMVGVLMTARATAWSLGQVGLFEPGDKEPRAVTRPAAFTLEKAEGAVIRKLQTSAWVKNEIGVDGICVAALAPGADVPVRGFRLCVLGSDCRRLIGCGEVP